MRPPRYLAGLLIALAGALVVPAGIVGIGFVVEAANFSAGWMQVRLPRIFFWIFAWGGGLSPLVGAASLWLLRRYQRRQVEAGVTDRATVWELAVRALSLLAMLAPVLWFVLLARMFFMAGGIR